VAVETNAQIKLLCHKEAEVSLTILSQM